MILIITKRIIKRISSIPTYGSNGRRSWIRVFWFFIWMYAHPKTNISI